MAIYSGFTYSEWWFSIVMLVYQRVPHTQFTSNYPLFPWGLHPWEICGKSGPNKAPVGPPTSRHRSHQRLLPQENRVPWTSLVNHHLEVSIVMGVPLYRWMVDFMENPNQKWKMTGGSPMFHQFSPKIIHHFPSSFLSKLMIAWKPSLSPKKRHQKQVGPIPHSQSKSSWQERGRSRLQPKRWFQ